MTFTIELPPATLRKLEAKAKATGKDIPTLVVEAVEVDLALTRMSLQDALQPIQDAIASSGMSPEDAEAFLGQELQAHRAERRAQPSRP